VKRLVLLVALPSLLLAACGGESDSRPAAGTGTGTTDGPASAQTFTIRGTDADAFAPATVLAQVGTLTLTLKNGGVPHDLVFEDKALPGIAAVNGAATKSTVLTFTRAGTYAFVCTIHPGMAGKVVVG
jgi:plastocyanin